MSMTFARLLDPAFEDDHDPFRHYDPAGEPLEDRLYLPCGIDPHSKVCGVAFVHPLPHRQDVLVEREIRNNSLEDVAWLIGTGQRLAPQFQAHPIYVFEATGPFWKPYRNFLHQVGLATATICGRQSRHARGTGTRKTKHDLKDAYLIAKVFKQGESHATRIPPEPLASLREYTRQHLFFVEYSVAIQNRMYNLRYQLHPDFDAHFSQPLLPTTLALMREELVYPEHLKAYPLDALTQLIRQASHGKLGAGLAQALVHSAQRTFSAPTAGEALSFNLKMLAQAYEHIHQAVLPPIRQRIEEGLRQLPFEHHLDEIPYFGPIVIGTFLSELGWPAWFRSVDSVVAWFGFDPSVSLSAGKPSGTTHLTKRGTKYGRRIMWLAARNWAEYTSEGRALVRKVRQQNELSYDGAICVLAAKLVRIAFAMVRDGSHFDMRRAFP
ncbi:MAG: IS110 family transposase [Anaerolineae bacterium]